MLETARRGGGAQYKALKRMSCAGCLSHGINSSENIIITWDFAVTIDNSFPDLLVVSTMLVSALSMMANVIVLRIYAKTPERQVPAICRMLVFDCMAKLLCYNKKTCTGHNRNTEYKMDIIKPGKEADENGGIPNVTYQGEVDLPVNDTIQPRPCPVNAVGRTSLKECTLADVNHIDDNTWRDVAMIINRLFIIIFFVIFLFLAVYAFLMGSHN